MKNPNKNLVRDISACLIIKGLLLTALWWVCFSHPDTENHATEHLIKIFSTARTYDH